MRAEMVHASVANAEVGKVNRDRVRQYFKEHIGCTRIECAEALGLSVATVSRHLEIIQSEWRSGGGDG